MRKQVDHHYKYLKSSLSSSSVLVQLCKRLCLTFSAAKILLNALIKLLRQEFFILFCFSLVYFVGFFFSDFIIQHNSSNLAQRVDAWIYHLPLFICVCKKKISSRDNEVFTVTSNLFPYHFHGIPYSFSSRLKLIQV